MEILELGAGEETEPWSLRGGFLYSRIHRCSSLEVPSFFAQLQSNTGFQSALLSNIRSRDLR